MSSQSSQKVFVTAAEALKSRVREAARVALAEFEDETGVSPSSVTIEMVKVTTRHDALGRFVLGEVTIGFDL